LVRYTSTINIINSIIWGNLDEIQEDDCDITLVQSSSLNSTYSNIEEGEESITIDDAWGAPAGINWLEGNIDEDPLFLDDNFTLQGNSPCIDAGSTSIEIEGEPFLDYGLDGLPGTFDFGEDNDIRDYFSSSNTWEEYEDLNGNGVWDRGFSFNDEDIPYHGEAIDIGAYEFESSPETQPGDVNADGNLDVLDIVSIVNFILEFSEYTDEQFDIADVNQDGSMDVIDIVLLVGIILNS